MYTVTLLVIAGFCEAVMDTLAHHFEDSVFSGLNKNWWNPVYSGSNKWKNGDKSQGPKRFLSTTLLVGFYDGWHLFKMFRTLSIFMSFAILFGFIPSLIAMLIFKLAFTIYYKLLLK
jgi:hypothetical protein